MEQFSADTTLSHYRIISRIGAGAMGEVYLAQDTKLGRRVALKILPQEFAADADRMRRFVLEAKSASALNHPNIITIYEIGQAQSSVKASVHFIASEFIEGQTLNTGGPLSLTAALDVATQIASALQAAHAAGIIHRDIKPENVIIRPDGLVKVLDFGVAKQSGPTGVTIGLSSGTDSEAATAVKSGTGTGMIVGTASYMSPEQARGRAIDARTDIFSLGVVLYEMLAARRPFAGENAMDVIGSIIADDPPPLAQLLSSLPPEIDRIVDRALRKKLEERYQTTSELLVDLKNLQKRLEFQAELQRTGPPDRNQEEKTLAIKTDPHGQAGLPEEKLPRATNRALEENTALFQSAETRSDDDNSARSQPHLLDTSAAPQPETTNPTLAPLSRISRRNVFLLSLVLFLLGGIGLSGYWFFGNHLTKQIESIAVMPFVNESGNADIEYLSDGMTETLIRSLSQLPNLNVKARSSVFRYKGKTADAKTIGKELGVQAILNGRVVQRGDQLTLSLELIDSQTENVIWTDQYDRKSSDLVSLQNEIARDVSSKLKTKLSGTDTQKLVKTYTVNAEAYRLYLQGRFYWNKREEKDFRKALEYYNQAIALDPNYALAYAGLADTYALLSTFGFMPPTDGVPKAREFARQAVSLDSGLAEPHTTLGYLSLTYDYDFAASEPEFRRSIELNPNYATAHQWYAELLTNAGRADEASVEYRRALEIEPLSLPINWDYGRFLYMSRRYDESLVQHRKTIELDPGFARAHRTIAEVYRIKGDYANAVEERAKFFDLIGQSQNAALIRATFAKDGWVGFLRLVIAENSPLRDSNNNWVIAKAYVDLGEKDKAFVELNKAYEIRLSSLCWLKVEPQMDPLRSDPRYQELLRKMNFPQ